MNATQRHQITHALNDNSKNSISDFSANMTSDVKFKELNKDIKISKSTKTTKKEGMIHDSSIQILDEVKKDEKRPEFDLNGLNHPINLRSKIRFDVPLAKSKIEPSNATNQFYDKHLSVAFDKYHS